MVKIHIGGAALLVLFCLSTCTAQVCIADLETYLGTCGAILGYKFLAGQRLAACPDYWRAKSCIWYYLSPCNTTTQTKWNATYAPITNLFDLICPYYRIPTAGGIPTQSPVCNLTEIYIESNTCIGSLEADAAKLKYAWDLPPFCRKYKSAWACSMGWIRPCSYAEQFFNQTMESIKTRLDPYCGDPDAAAGVLSSVMLAIASLLVALSFQG